MIENKLRKIFNWYNKVYNLNARLEFATNELNMGNYDSIENLITLNLKHQALEAKRTDRKSILEMGHIQTRSVHKAIYLTLLHEIKHAIDRAENKTLMEKELSEVNYFKYINDSNYHNNCSFEKRATKFAEEHFKEALQIYVNK